MKMKMTWVITLLLTLSVQNAIAFNGPKEVSFPDRNIRDIAVLEDGYLVAGYIEHSTTVNHVINHTYTPFVMKVDRGMDIVWEKTFKEDPHPVMESMLEMDGYIYVAGSYHIGKVAHGWLAKLDAFGEVIWEQKFERSGYHSTEAKTLCALPNGTILLMNSIYRNWSSMQKTWLVNLDQNGKRLWEKTPGQQFVLSQPVGIVPLQNGNMMVTGCVYRDRSDLSTSNGKGWVLEIDYANGGNIVWEKQYAQYGGLVFNRGIRLENGNILVSGRVNGTKGTSEAIIARLDSKGNFLNIRRFPMGTSSLFNSITKLNSRGTFLAVGHAQRKTYLVEFDKNMNVIRQEQGGEGAYRKVINYPEGEITLHNRTALFFE